MPIAKEGLREIVLGTLILGACAAGGYWLWWPVAVPFVILWLWVVSFFRDPRRRGWYDSGELCAPADGKVTEITELEDYEGIDGPAVRIGIFLSIFDIHINRTPCAGRIRLLAYRPGEFLDARHRESGQRNEANTLLIDPDPPLFGPLVVRQVAGVLARRIICHAQVDEHLPMGARFGMIKFGSRTELIIPRRKNTEIKVGIGDKVKAGLTIVARQPVETIRADVATELQHAGT